MILNYEKELHIRFLILKFDLHEYGYKKSKTKEKSIFPF